jgi:hypothetical protein
MSRSGRGVGPKAEALKEGEIVIGRRRCPPIEKIFCEQVHGEGVGNRAAQDAIRKKDASYRRQEAKAHRDANAWVRATHCAGECVDNGSMVIGPLKRHGRCPS